MAKKKMIPEMRLENIRLELPSLNLIGDRLQELLAGASEDGDGEIKISVRDLVNLSGTMNMSLGGIEKALNNRS